jgi:hypothetical protein
MSGESDRLIVVVALRWLLHGGEGRVVDVRRVPAVAADSVGAEVL